MATDPDGRGGPHVFVTDIESPELAEADRHHLARVLRLREGDPLTVGDGAGRWRPCRFGDSVTPVSEPVMVPANDSQLTVGFALVKGARPELVVQKLTELGVDHIALFEAERSVVRWDDDRVKTHRQRLTRVAREAAMQSRRSWLPTLEVLAALDDLLARPGAAMADRDGGPLSDLHRCLVIGPEGGWTDAERSLATERVRLGRHVQRAETAAIAAGVRLTAARDQMTDR